MKTKYNEYWYFRNQADEVDDDDINSSVMIALDQITSIIPIATTQISIYFRQSTAENARPEVLSDLNGQVVLNVTAGKSESVMRALVADINAGPRNKPRGITTIADDSTTDFDDSTRSPIYIHPGITSVNEIRLR